MDYRNTSAVSRRRYRGAHTGIAASDNANIGFVQYYIHRLKHSHPALVSASTASAFFAESSTLLGKAAFPTSQPIASTKALVTGIVGYARIA
jgi:hypothetical protein